jgi:hypothetical protein
MALVDQIDKLACGAGDALGTGQQACPIDWDRISTIKLTPKGQVYTDIDSLETVRTATIKVRQLLSITLIDVFSTTRSINRYNRGGKRLLTVNYRMSMN